MKKIYTKPKRDKKAEKIAFLQKYAIDEWVKTRKEADEEVSREHEMWCVCRKLCTGLHESSCRQFQNKVNTRTVQKLKHLWEEKQVAFPKILN